MDEKVKILLVEDVLTDAELAMREIRKSLQADFLCVETRDDYLKALEEYRPDLIISDYQMPVFDGLTALRIALETAPDVPVIILTAATNEDTAVGCMKAGAKDYVIKEHIKRLGQAVVHALTEKSAAAQRIAAEQEKLILEQKLQESQKLESIGRLAGGVAHDFNNMLGVIIGYSEIIKSELPENSPILPSVREIEKAATRSRDITRQLLAFSRKQLIIPKPMNLNNLIRSSSSTLLHLIGEDINVSFELAEDLWTIIFDPTQAEQILMNLLVNARDAMPKGGRLIIKTENIIINDGNCHQHPDCFPGKYIKVTMEDNGTGIDEAILPFIFEPFFTTKEKGMGTGLGLSTVYGNVKQNGGFITVESKVGKGTRFILFLPGNDLCEEVIDESEQKCYEKTDSTDETILLVEDEAILRQMIAGMLKIIGYKVITAANPTEAILVSERAKDRIGLLLTDVVMPEMNGDELRKRINRIIPGIKTVFISGYASDVIINKGAFIDDFNFLQKPFNTTALAKKINVVLQKKQ